MHRQQTKLDTLRNWMVISVAGSALYTCVIVPSHAQMEFDAPRPSNNINLESPVAELGPSLSADGLVIYFASSLHPGPDYPDGEYYLYSAARDSIHDDWGIQQPLPIELNQGGDSGPSLSSDGLTLFFTRGDENGPALLADIYTATRDSLDTPWGSPRPLIEVNAVGVPDAYPDVSVRLPHI